MAAPEIPVVCVIGDGGLYMTPLGCLETARVHASKHSKSSLTVLVLENQAYGMIEYGAKYIYKVPDILSKLEFGSYSTEKFSRFQGTAQSFGFTTRKVTAARDLGKILSTCVNTPGLHLVECPLDYTEADKILAS
ncbi:unnamed protein product [Polarella glacialis]|uniref:Thiamine pyrophosphate enzyme TPP-binding domain-containing protein n=1 Tax=Polarella glacialis TaxID=89957 RepID=A0A813GCB9_POLGL|nr:unnamed protein product [Polarella glacialis]